MNKIIVFSLFSLIFFLSIQGIVTSTTDDANESWSYNLASDPLLSDGTGAFNLTNNGSTRVQQSGTNYWYDFDGTNDYQRGYNFKPAGAMTIAAWMITNASANQDIVIKDSTTRDWKLRQAVNGSIICLMETGATNVQYGGSNMDDGNLHHVACVNDGTDLLVYIDGSLSTGTGNSKGGSQSHNEFNFIIGNGLDGSGNPDNTFAFDGFIDQVMLFDRGLNSSEISELFNGGTIFDPYGAVPGVPGITQITYNHSTAISSGNETVWRTNTSTPSWTFDQTPTIRFDTNVSADCRFSITDVNYSSMNSTMDCSTTGAQSHVCSLWTPLAVNSGFNSLYVGCANANNASEETVLSTSGALNVSLGIYNLAGTTLDSNGVAVPNSKVVIMYQDNNTFLANVTSNATGNWSYELNISDTSINYLFYGFDPANSSRAADIKHFVTVS